MTRRNVLQAVLLGAGVALATAVLGWYVVPALGCFWGLMACEADRPALSYGLAAGLGWVVLLVWTASHGPMGVLAALAAGVFGITSAVLYAVTVLFAVAVAWSSAAVGEFVGRSVRSREELA